MKIAITSTGNTLKSKLDKHFGSCLFFAIYDTETKDVEFINNPKNKAEERIRSATVDFVASIPVEKVVSGIFGFKVKALLVELRIQMVTIKDYEKTVEDIINLLDH